MRAASEEMVDKVEKLEAELRVKENEPTSESYKLKVKAMDALMKITVSNDISRLLTQEDEA